MIKEERLEYFRKRLKEEMDKISGQMNSIEDRGLHKSLRESSGDLSAYSLHMADVASDNYDMEQSLQIRSQQEKYYYKLEEAMQRLDEGTYGLCEVCGKGISEERLDAIPAAGMCVSCKEKKNKGL